MNRLIALTVIAATVAFGSCKQSKPTPHGKVGISGLIGPIDIPYGVPSYPQPGITRVAADNSGNLIESIGGGAYSTIGSGGGGSFTGLPDGGVTAPLSGAGVSASPLTIATGATLPAHVVADPTSGINRILTLNANVSAGDPAMSFKSNGTEVGYIRVDSTGAINIVPVGASSTGLLWTSGEANWKFGWGTSGLAFYQGTLRGQQSVGAALTDGTSGGTAGTLTTFAGSTYTTDAPIILGDLHQLAIKVAAIQAALGSTGVNLVSP